MRHALAAASAPFDPWIRWAVSDAEWVVKFPVNSIELSFFATIVSLVLYVTVSLITCRKPFDLEKMLHRGKWSEKCAQSPANGNSAIDNRGQSADNRGQSAIEANRQLPSCIAGRGRPEAAPHGNFLRRLLDHLVGINAEYTREDRILAWTVFGYSICYGFFGTFALVALLARIFHWGPQTWTVKMFVTGIAVPLAMGIATTVWFTWGTTRDIRRLFRDLETRVRDDSDNGMVSPEAKPSR